MSRIFIQHHKHALNHCLQALVGTPWASFMTVLVFAIALALPAGLLIMTQNALQLSYHWQQDTHITVFLKQDMAANKVEALMADLNLNHHVAKIVHLAPGDVLQEFQRFSHFGQTLDHLGELQQQPFPHVLMITPVPATKAFRQVDAFLQELQQLPEVDFAEYDSNWAKKLHYILKVCKQLFIILLVLLGCATLLIVGNTLRLLLKQEQENIIISKLVGATNAFVRRPYLYVGAAYGLLGGVLGLSLLLVMLHLLNHSVTVLASLYEHQFQLMQLPAQQCLWFLLVSMMLGWLSALVVAAYHLKNLDFA